MQAAEPMIRPSPFRQRLSRLAREIYRRPDRSAPVTYSRPLVLYVAAVAAAAVAVSAATVRGVDDVAGVLVLAAAIFLLAASGVQVVPDVTVASNASSLVNLGMAVTFGPLGALTGAVAEATGSLVRYRTGWFRMLFNASSFVLCNLAAWAAFDRVSRLPVDNRMALSLAGMAAGVTVLALNTLLVGGVIAVATRSPLLRRCREVLTGIWYTALYAWGIIPFPIVHDRAGALGVTWLLAPVVATQALLMVLAARVRVHNAQRAQLMERIQEQSIRVERSYDATLVALTHALDARDRETEGHSRRVVEYTREIATRLGITGPELTTLSHGALLHDIGKIGVPDAILHKPGPLTPEEWETMRRHPRIGASMVEGIEVLEDARLIILHHHERYDGTGYPAGLRGREISLGARTFAVADAVDAMTQDRPYRLGCSLDRAREELLRVRGGQFDPDVVDAFLSLPEARLEEIRRLRAQVGIDLLAGPSAAGTVVRAGTPRPPGRLHAPGTLRRRA